MNVLVMAAGNNNITYIKCISYIYTVCLHARTCDGLVSSRLSIVRRQ